MFMQDTYGSNKLIRRSNKRKEDFFLKQYLTLTLLQGFERLCEVLLWEGAGDRT